MPPERQRPVILIHGAWQGSWVWSDLIPLLEAAGLHPVAVDLPGNGTDDVAPSGVSLDLYVAHIGRIIADLEGQVAVVGHSGGGVVATAAAERFRERVDRIAFVAGMMLPSAVAFGDLLRDMEAEKKGLLGIGPHLVWSDDRQTTIVPAEAAANIFLSDMDRKTALSSAARLRPQPQGCRAMSASWTAERFGTLPRLYVECTGDRSVAPALQRRMQEIVPGAERATIETGHVPQVSAPALLAEALIPFLTR